MKEFVFIVGGARSGKSRHAQEIAKLRGGKVAFLATCLARDNEMKERISQHKKSRPRQWKVIEAPNDLRSALRGLGHRFDTVIIDCLGLFVSNLLLDGQKEEKIKGKIEAIAKTLRKAKYSSIVVSNEVGGGIVPDNALARQFRDVVGISNQIMSRSADTVYIMQAGMPTKLKGENDHE